MIRPTASAAAVLGLTAICAIAAAGGGFGRGVAPDAVLAHDYGRALADADVAWTTRPPNVWLSSLDGAAPPLAKALAVGDTITIAGRGGRPDAIEVTGLEQVEGERIGMPGLRFQLVTGHKPGSAGQSGSQVRFLFAIDAAEPPASPRAADRVL